MMMEGDEPDDTPRDRAEKFLKDLSRRRMTMVVGKDGKSRTVGEVLADLAVDALLPANLRRRVKNGPLTAIVTVPTAQWIDPIVDAIRELAGEDSRVSMVSRDKVQKDRDMPSLMDWIAEGRPVLGVSHIPDAALPPLLLNVSELRLVVPRLPAVGPLSTPAFVEKQAKRNAAVVSGNAERLRYLEDRGLLTDEDTRWLRSVRYHDRVQWPALMRLDDGRFVQLPSPVVLPIEIVGGGLRHLEAYCIVDRQDGNGGKIFVVAPGLVGNQSMRLTDGRLVLAGPSPDSTPSDPLGTQLDPSDAPLGALIGTLLISPR